MKLFERVKRIAFNLFDKNHDHRCFHVTFIIKKSKIRSVGINACKTNSKNLKYSYIQSDGLSSGFRSNSHSELMAFVKYRQLDCSDCTIINIRIDRNGVINNSKFCPQCQKLLDSIGYKKAFYSTASGEFEEFKKTSQFSCTKT